VSKKKKKSLRRRIINHPSKKMNRLMVLTSKSQRGCQQTHQQSVASYLLLHPNTINKRKINTLYTFFSKHPNTKHSTFTRIFEPSENPIPTRGVEAPSFSCTAIKAVRKSSVLAPLNSLGVLSSELAHPRALKTTAR
jgi:hypothetical protein